MDVLLSRDGEDERSTLPPEADDDEDGGADLLASVALQLDTVAQGLTRATKSLAVLVGQRRADNKRITTLEARVAALEDSQ